MGSDALEVRASKGKKGSGGRGSQSLESILEVAEVGAGCSEGLRLIGCVDETPSGEMLEDQIWGSSSLRLEETPSNQEWQKESIPNGGVNDCALDLVSPQPLQAMEFVTEQVLPSGSVGVLGSGCLLREINLPIGNVKEGDKARVEQIVEET